MQFFAALTFLSLFVSLSHFSSFLLHFADTAADINSEKLLYALILFVYKYSDAWCTRNSSYDCV